MIFRNIFSFWFILTTFELIYCKMLKGTPSADLQKLYTCEDFENKDIVLYVSVSRANVTTQLITANLTSLVTVDKTFKFRATLFRFINDHWHKEVAIVKDNPCVSLSIMIGPTFQKILRDVHIKKCPIRAGFYEIKEYPADAHSIPMMYAPGLFKLKVEVFKKPNILKFCFNAEFFISIDD